MSKSAVPCGSCGQAIIWVKDQNGTRLPLNNRRVRVYENGEDAGWHYKEVLESSDAKLFHISHFLTCPNAKEHSKS